MATVPTPSPAPTDPGLPPSVGGVPSAPAPTAAPTVAPSQQGSTINPPNQGANNTPTETAIQRQVRALVEALVTGTAKWEDLSDMQRRAVLYAVGIDPNSSPTEAQVLAAAQLYLASVQPGFSGGAPSASGTGNMPVEAPEITGQAGPGAGPDPWVEAITELYVRLWGEPPTARWLQQAIDSGMNLFEIELQERSKPAWIHTKRAQDEFAERAAALASALGLR